MAAALPRIHIEAVTRHRDHFALQRRLEACVAIAQFGAQLLQ